MTADREALAARFGLAGQTVLVTGASGLIGSGVAHAMIEAGARVVAADIAEAAQIRAALPEGAEEAGRAQPVTADIATADGAQRAVTACTTGGGRLDCLVHCAAIDAKFDAQQDDLAKMHLPNFPLAQWQRSLDVNVTGTLAMLQAAIPPMQSQGGGTIVLVGSCYSLVSPDPDLYRSKSAPEGLVKPVDYVATKSVIPNLTRYVAAHYGDSGIRANCLVPHGIDNDHPDWFRANFAQRTPLRRMCALEELKAPFIFLAGPGASYMTGATLVVDGGWTIW